LLSSDAQNAKEDTLVWMLLNTKSENSLGSIRAMKAMTFPCYDAQTVAPETVEYRLKSEFV